MTCSSMDLKILWMAKMLSERFDLVTIQAKKMVSFRNTSSLVQRIIHLLTYARLRRVYVRLCRKQSPAKQIKLIQSDRCHTYQTFSSFKDIFYSLVGTLIATLTRAIRSLVARKPGYDIQAFHIDEQDFLSVVRLRIVMGLLSSTIEPFIRSWNL